MTWSQDLQNVNYHIGKKAFLLKNNLSIRFSITWKNWPMAISKFFHVIENLILKRVQTNHFVVFPQPSNTGIALYINYKNTFISHHLQQNIIQIINVVYVHTNYYNCKLIKMYFQRTVFIISVIHFEFLNCGLECSIDNCMLVSFADI